MSGARFLVLLVAACALVATALMAIPMDDAEGTVHTGSIAPAPQRLTPPPSASRPAVSTVEQEAAMPRIWLGGPVIR
jgi:hypothetical protein